MMMPIRLALLASPALLLAACGNAADQAQDPARGQDDAPATPLGAELATATDADANAGAPAGAGMIDLTPQELAARLAGGNVRLIDVRTDAEVAEGMIPGAEHIALDRFDPAKLDLSDGREVVLYCRSGRRSAIASERLAAATGKPVEHLAGGIVAWEDAGQPVAAR